MSTRKKVPDLDEDIINEIGRLFLEFKAEHGFSEKEILHTIIRKDVFEKEFVVHERFKRLIEEHIGNVNHAHLHKHHTITFQKIGSPNNWRMIINAECLEFYFLEQILKSILKNFEFEKEDRVKKNNALVKEKLISVASQLPVSNTVYKTWYKKGVYFASVRIKRKKITLEAASVMNLQNMIEDSLPILIESITKKKDKKG